MQNDGITIHFSDDEGRELGERNEQRFLDAWNTAKNRPAWFSEVRKARLRQDFFEHTDAFLVRTDGTEIPIQVKTKNSAAHDFIERFNSDERGIVVVVIADEDTAEDIVQSTLRSLDLMNERIREKKKQALKSARRRAFIPTLLGRLSGLDGEH